MTARLRLTVLLLAVAPAAVAQTNLPPAARMTITDQPVTAEGHIVGSGTNGFNGTNLNTRVGANSYYTAGYTGTNAVLANIEGGLTWNGHESLSQGQITQYITGPGTVGAVNGTAAAVDRHATWTGQTMVGRTTTGGGEYQRGVAYNSTLWAGTIATSFGTPPYSLSFGIATYNAFFSPYVLATRTGIGGVTADVVNSSWGSFAAGNNDISAGRNSFAWGMDALARDTRKVFVFSAGNSGPTTETVGAPATGYNVISVGALTGDAANPSYNTAASFSSRGLHKAFNPSTSAFVSNARVRIDISAPGDEMTLAFYGGTTGGNTGGTNQAGTALYSGGLGGTSFAAPIVAAGAGLMVDAAKQLGLSNGTDGRVIKAVLLNAADKPAGWTNAQSNVGGVVQTTQALDSTFGAGRMNLTQALAYQTSASSTRDVPGTTPGDQGTVLLRGYDLGAVSEAAFNSYRLGTVSAPAGSVLTATLNWYANRTIDSFTAPTQLFDNALADLDLEIWQVDANGNFVTKVAQSISDYNNTEHLFFTTTGDSRYGLRVTYANDQWDFVTQTQETYALAWNLVPVPEPAGVGLVLALAVGAVVRRRYFVTTSR